MSECIPPDYVEAPEETERLLALHDPRRRALLEAYMRRNNKSALEAANEVLCVGGLLWRAAMRKEQQG